ncbi:MAG TPA: CPBP family intramembrane glutamic endopeptidase [Candidatus Binataceae bacterium]|nr:CPBP family intramembrane glutamic endopeptidase [Candidatus Binataceae bacterium]
MPKSFTARFLVALVVGVAVAVVVAPFVALAVAGAGYSFPFPRIFDRVVMVTLAIVIVISARSMRLFPLLRAGFADPIANLPRAGRGMVVALAVMMLLFAAGFAMGGFGHAGHALRMLPKYVLSAIVIGIIEEAFFRALVMGGMEADFGRTGALVISAAVYSVAHLVRAPAHFYVTALDLTAGVRTLGLSFTQLASPLSALPTLFGLFLLGLALGEAFAVTGTVWFSAGLHAGFVIGAKLWPKLVVAHSALPGWLAGWGHQPLISGAAAWLAAIGVLILLRPLAGLRRDRGTA